MKKLADDGESVVGVELASERVEVEVPVVAIAVDVRNIAVPHRAVEMCNISPITPPAEYSSG